MYNSPVLQACHPLCVMLGLPENAAARHKFELPTSKNARKLLFGILNGMASFSATKLKETSAIVTSDYNPIKYEETAYRYDATAIVKTIPKRIKSLDEYRRYFTLEFLKDEKWWDKANIPRNRTATSVFSPAAIELYQWLASEFLLSDFSDHDLGKIIHLGSDTYDIEVIKAEARKILDIDKRSVSYLYAIVRDISIRQHNHRLKEEQNAKLNLGRLAQMMSEVVESPSSGPYDPQDQARLRELRAYAIAARKMKRP